MTFWSEDIDKFVSKFEENKIYIISGADVKKCGAYNKTEHSYELHCNKSTQITLGQETSNIKQFNINMEALSSINTEKTEATKTVYCVIFSLPQLSEITKKDGTSLKKISFNIIDQSQQSVEIIGWGDDMWDYLKNFQVYDIVIVSNMTLREFNNTRHFGISYPQSKIILNPAVPKEKSNDMIKFRNDLKSGIITDIKMTTNGKGSQALLYTLEAIQADAKKRILEGNEDKIYYSAFAYLSAVILKRPMTWEKNDDKKLIFLAQCKIADHTCSEWVTVTGAGETIFGLTPEEASRMYDESKEALAKDSDVKGRGLTDYLATRKGIGYWMKIRYAKNQYNGNNSLKATLVNAYGSPSEQDKNCSKTNRALMNTLKLMMAPTN